MLMTSIRGSEIRQRSRGRRTLDVNDALVGLQRRLVILSYWIVIVK
jgi:hypothetical protein